MGGAVAALAPRATAFPHRGAAAAMAIAFSAAPSYGSEAPPTAQAGAMSTVTYAWG